MTCPFSLPHQANCYVVENAPSTRQPVTTNPDGTGVVALQGSDSDSLTFSLEGPGEGRFDIDRTRADKDEIEAEL